MCVSLTKASRHDDLHAGAKTKAQHDNHKIKHAAQRRGAQLDFAYMTQKGRISYINYILCHTPENNRVGNRPDAFV